jgi:putative FmdB family regulatory protein
MPTYDYKCTECEESFEFFQKMTDAPVEICPQCGGKLKRMIGTGMTPIFKGSGFYETDYKKNSSNGNGSNGKSNGTGTAAKSKTAEKKSSESSKSTQNSESTKKPA